MAFPKPFLPDSSSDTHPTMDTDAFPSPSSPGSSRKRQRTLDDNLDDSQNIPSPDDEPIVPPVRDTFYYREDGDCVIRVKNTLFKVSDMYVRPLKILGQLRMAGA